MTDLKERKKIDRTDKQKVAPFGCLVYHYSMLDDIRRISYFVKTLFIKVRGPQ